jgi:hypothetical protein
MLLVWVTSRKCSEMDGLGRNALLVAVLNDRANGRTALSMAIACNRYGLVQWLLEEDGADINDKLVIQGKHGSVWDHLRVHLHHNTIVDTPTGLQSLLQFMVLLDDAPPDFIAKLSRQNTEIAIQGRQIRVLRPSYLEQQHALITATSPLPTVLQSIVATYAEPTPEDMWTDWMQWM